MKDKKTIEAYPIKKLPQSWREAVSFMGCGNHRDAVIIYLKNGHSGEGFYTYCNEYPDEGAVFLGTN